MFYCIFMVVNFYMLFYCKYILYTVSYILASTTCGRDSGKTPSGDRIQSHLSLRILTLHFSIGILTLWLGNEKAPIKLSINIV